jgi:hypothetical protein
MKYQCTIKMVGCGAKLLDEIRGDMESALDAMNFEKKFPDGGWVKSQTSIDIDGTTVTVTAIFEGEGETYLEYMHKMEQDVLTGEFQASFKREYANEKPEKSCTSLKAFVTKL